MMTVPQLAKRVHRTPAAVYRWLTLGISTPKGGVVRLKFTQYPKARMVSEADFQAFLAELTRGNGGVAAEIAEPDLPEVEFTDADYPERRRGRRKAG